MPKIESKTLYISSPVSTCNGEGPLIIESKTFRTNKLKKLEAIFSSCPFPCSQLKKSLATELNMTERTVQIWFQNRRARIRAKTNKAPVNKALQWTSPVLNLESKPEFEVPELTDSSSIMSYSNVSTPVIGLSRSNSMSNNDRKMSLNYLMN